MYEDKTLICKECGAEFIFTAGEQEFYAEKGFVNEPQRCKSCRDARRCTSPSAPTAAKRRRFPSSPARIGLCTAASASPACAAKAECSFGEPKKPPVLWNGRLFLSGRAFSHSSQIRAENAR